MTSDKDTAAPERRDSPPGNGLSRGIVMMFAALLIGYYLAGRVGNFLRDDGPVVRDFTIMNTYARLTIPESGTSDLTPNQLADLAEEAVRRVDTLMSPFGEHSDVRRLNAAPAGEWVDVDPLTWTVVMEALRWHRLTGGAFDPTIGPIKRLFVFDQSETDVWPDAESFAEARSRVGAEKLRFDREGMRLSWSVDGMRLDLGGIAKGYAADLAAESLIDNGVSNALIDIGGELRVLGQKPGDPPGFWKTGIRNPRRSEVLETLELTNVGVATSGDYERFFIYQGKRHEHIIDPRTGLPLTEHVASATVLHPRSCLAADALATAMCVLGPDEGKEFLKGQALGLFSSGVRVIMLLSTQEGLLRLEYRIDDKGGFSETIAVVG